MNDPHIRELLRDWTARDWIAAAAAVILLNLALAFLH